MNEKYPGDSSAYTEVEPGHISMTPEHWMPIQWDCLCKRCGVNPNDVERLVLTPSTVDVFFAKNDSK